MNNNYTSLSREVYCSPDCTLYTVNVNRTICQNSPNSTPDLEWGDEYNEEPED